MVLLNRIKSVDYLDGEEVIAEYLSAAMEGGDPEVFLAALADVAKARGMALLAKETGLGRESLYKSLSPGAKPRFDTILKIIDALGVSLTVIANAERKVHKIDNLRSAIEDTLT